MRITIESTDMLTYHNGARTRVWKGMTESGKPVCVFVAGLAVETKNDQGEFLAELRETEPPLEIRSIDKVLSARLFMP
ncbi:MAG TPA: hypothetical protein VH439_17450 [Gemmatimonadales bacterium]|jgi:hypothetical protein